LPAKAGEAIKLLSILRKTSAPLGLYEIITMKWHFFSMQQILRHQRMSDTSHFFNRNGLYKYLFSRYHMDGGRYNIEKEITHPSSAATVKIILHDAMASFE